MRRRAIRDLPFRHNTKPALGFEILSLANIFDRADRGAIDHPLDLPQRPEFHSIYVGTRGKGKLVVDFTPTPIGAGYMTFVASGRVHQFVPDRSVDAALLVFSPEFLDLDPRALDPLRAPAVLSPAWEKPALAIGGDRELVQLVSMIETEHARRQDAVQAPLLQALLRALLLRAERLALQVQRPPPPAELVRFFTILEMDHMRTRSVTHYAKKSGLSARTLGELLTRHTGRSTKQVIDERVVLELKRLLAHTDLSVKELAERMGFDEPTNLVKFFRVHANTTPQAFRRTFLSSGRRS
ncbi:MAG TPA: helix-turn-helix transcriptional regulator [Kofleriaceae bacterium]|nr:helix-turn-helix transcriptional regulator [Kofleriaceae bacterium]